jgi:hypothetical protein
MAGFVLSRGSTSRTSGERGMRRSRLVRTRTGAECLWQINRDELIFLLHLFDPRGLWNAAPDFSHEADPLHAPITQLHAMTSTTALLHAIISTTAPLYI